MTPAFHFDILKPYNKLSKAAEESKSVDIFCQAGLATLDSLLQCAFTPLHLSDFIYKQSANGREFYKNSEFVHTFSDGDGVGLSDEEIRDEVDTFMFAVIGWSMYALGKYPEQQAKVHDEVKEVLGQRQSVGEDLSKLKYLTCFLKEVMRLYTPVPVASRMVSKPITIEGVTIPKGTYIDLGFYHIHHNPDVWPDPWPVLIVGHPDTARDIMKSSEPKPQGIPGYGFLKHWIGDSILVSQGKKWERNRHLLTPAFHFDILKPYVSIFNQVADVLIQKMEKPARTGSSFEVFKPAGLATLDTLLQCALSYKGNIQELGQIHLWPEFIYRHSTQGKLFHKLCHYVHDFSGKIITERKKALKENPDILKKRHLDFLDILLTAKDEHGEGLTDEEISNEVDTFMFAGHDTTSCVLSWSVYALGKHVKQQDKLYNEISQVLDGRKHIEWEDLAKMKYLHCFLREVMRLYTPVPFVSRSLTKTQVINGVTISEGTHIDLGLFLVSVDPDYEPDMEFDVVLRSKNGIHVKLQDREQ
ncbi:hypothetical protein KUTeg_010378 [Tegillarca granosa]|uniref:Uncharacterized protein n=1 Tax=Tegillarca granosa TaxID=220873 RepID=A0ABQ9FBI6_TEGGR|nr:hypothetical protein KUTeg_010378 [Tegillarca granosa]